MANDDIGSISADLELDNTDWIADLNGTTVATEKFAKQIQQIGSRISNIGKNMMIFITAPILLFGGTAVKQFIDFEAAMRNVNTIARQTERQLENTSAEVLVLAQELGKAPTELAEALFFINSASFKGAEGMSVLAASTRAARAGVTEVATAAQAITAVLNAYNLTAAKATDVSDILFKTNELGVTTFEKLSSHLGTTVATAAAAKIPFEQVAAGIATMTRGGIRTSEAFVGMNRFILRLIQGTDELNAGFLSLTGTTAANVLQTQGLGAAVDVLRKLTGGGTEAMLKMGFRLRDLKAALSLTRNEGKDFAKDLEAIAIEGNRSGSTMAALSEQTKGLGFQVDRAKASFKALAITIGKDLAPVVRPIVDAIQRMFAWFQMLDPSIRKVVIVMAGLAALAGPVIFFFGKLVSMIGLIALAGPAIVTGFSAVAGIMGTLLPILGAVAFAIAAVGFAFVQIAGDGDTFGERLTSAISKVKQWMIDLQNWLSANGPSLWNHITAGAEMILIEFKFAFKQVELLFNVMAENIFTTMIGLGEDFMSIWNWWTSNFIVVFDDWLSVVTAFADDAIKLFQNLWDGIKSTFKGDGVGDLLEGVGDNLVNAVANLKTPDIPPPSLELWTERLRDWISEADALDAERRRAIEDSLNDPLNLAADVSEDMGKKLKKDTNESKNTIQAMVNMMRKGAGALERGSVAASRAVGTGIRAEDLQTGLIENQPLDQRIQQQLEINNEQEMSQGEELDKIAGNTNSTNTLLQTANEQGELMIEVMRTPQFETVGLA